MIKIPDLSEDDYAHVRKVIGYVHRHQNQQPSGDVEHTNWVTSLMNCGHDPSKRPQGSSSRPLFFDCGSVEAVAAAPVVTTW